MQDSTIKNFLSEVESLSSNAISVSKQVLDAGQEKVTVELLRSKVMPERMESPPRKHRFDEVAAFVEYIKVNKTDNTVIMADLKAGVFAAVLDDKAARGFEIIRMEPQKSPAFELLEQMLNQEMPVRAFARYAMRSRKVLGADEEAGRQFAMLMQQITIASKVTACQGTGRKSVNGLMCTTEVKSGEGINQVELPDEIEANVPIFVKRPIVKFGIDLTIMASQDVAHIIADAPELDVVKYEEMRKMLSEISGEIGGGAKVGIGVLNYAQWQYN